MTTYNVGYIVGSLAKNSINRKLAKALIKLAPEKLKFHEVSFADLPLYSYDYDADFPDVAKQFKADLKRSDAILIVTPEYNRSIPGGLKNAIDWGSRPWGKNSFARKPSAVIGTSPGSIGTAVAQQSLRSVLSLRASRNSRRCMETSPTINPQSKRSSMPPRISSLMRLVKPTSVPRRTTTRTSPWRRTLP